MTFMRIFKALCTLARPVFCDTNFLTRGLASLESLWCFRTVVVALIMPGTRSTKQGSHDTAEICGARSSCGLGVRPREHKTPSSSLASTKKLHGRLS